MNTQSGSLAPPKDQKRKRNDQDAVDRPSSKRICTATRSDGTRFHVYTSNSPNTSRIPIVNPSIGSYNRDDAFQKWQVECGLKYVDAAGRIFEPVQAIEPSQVADEINLSGLVSYLAGNSKNEKIYKELPSSTSKPPATLERGYPTPASQSHPEGEQTVPQTQPPSSRSSQKTKLNPIRVEPPTITNPWQNPKLLRDMDVTLGDGTLGARAVRFIKRHPHLDKEYTVSQLDEVLRLAKKHKWLELPSFEIESLKNKFLREIHLPNLPPDHPLASAIRFARLPEQQKVNWRYCPEDMRDILINKVDYLGLPLLRFQSAVGGLDKLFQYAKLPQNEDKGWGWNDLGVVFHSYMKWKQEMQASPYYRQKWVELLRARGQGGK